MVDVLGIVGVVVVVTELLVVELGSDGSVVVVEVCGTTSDGVLVTVVDLVVVVFCGVQPANAIIATEQIPRAISFECFIIIRRNK